MPDTDDTLSTMFDLSERPVWVIGGAGYLGLPVCELLARHGAQVIISDNRRQVAEVAVESLGKKGLAAISLPVNVSDEASCLRAEDEIRHRFGHLAAAVNMATYSTGQTMEKMTVDEWNRGLVVTLTGAFVWSRIAARLMMPKQCGSIIHFSSMYGMVSPDPRTYEPPMTVNPIDYGVSKAGVLQMMRYQSVAWGKDGIRVNAIVPGPFPNLALPGMDELFVERLAARTPLGRTGLAHEVAGAVLYLACDASSFVTGTSMVVDGGWMAW